MSLPLSELHAEYTLDLRIRDKSPYSIRNVDRGVQRLTEWLTFRQHSHECEALTTRLMRHFIADLQGTYAISTVARNVRTIKAMFAFGLREGLLAENPVESLSVPTVPEQDIDAFTPQDIESLLKVCNRGTFTGLRDFTVTLVLFDTGLRVAELCGLRDSDVDWNTQLLAVRGKGNKPRPVPVSARTLRAMRRYLNQRKRHGYESAPAFFVTNAGNTMTPRQTLKQLSELGKRVGLHVYPHKLRHSFAVNALRQGAREFDIQGCLGHASLAMTRHYARQTGHDLANAHKQWSPGDRLRVRT